MDEKPLPFLSQGRIARLKRGITLQALSSASGISMTALSAAERGLRPLTPQEERERRRALERLGSLTRGSEGS